MFLEISQNAQENTCARVSFLIKLQDWGWDSGTRCFPENFVQFLRTPFFIEHLRRLLLCFRKLKRLLAANMVIYLNISMSIAKIHGPSTFRARHSFLHRTTTSGVTSSWYLFHELENATSLYWENNYNLLEWL